MEEGFIKNLNFLEETTNTEDLFNFDEEKNNFKSKLDSLKGINFLGLIGDFGKGKSTLLSLVKKDIEKEEILWVDFDAWRYPDRKDLWDGFVLEFAESYGEDKGEIKGEIDGTPSTRLKLINQIIKIIPGLDIGLEKILSIDLENILFSEGIKRIYQYEDIFYKLIEKQEKDIVIVCEDTDQNYQDEGIVFLQTLRNFFKKYGGNFQTDSKSKNITIIIPISPKNYNNKKDNYIKIFDIKHDFKGLYTIDKFIDSIEITKLYELTTMQGNKLDLSLLKEFINRFIKEEWITIRELKFIFRNANNQYISLQREGYKKIDYRMCIISSILSETSDNISVSKEADFTKKDYDQYKSSYKYQVYRQFSGINGLPNYITSYIGAILNKYPSIFKNSINKTDLIGLTSNIKLIDKYNDNEIPIRSQFEQSIPIVYFK